MRDRDSRRAEYTGSQRVGPGLTTERQQQSRGQWTVAMDQTWLQPVLGNQVLLEHSQDSTVYGYLHMTAAALSLVCKA